MLASAPAAPCSPRPSPLPCPERSIALLGAYAAGLEDILQSLDSDATLFLPTDEAFTALLEKLDVNATTLLSDKKLLKSVFRFHLVPDVAAKAEDLKDGQRLVTDLGKRLTVIKGPDGVSLKTPGGVIVKVTEADVPAGKAVAHIISEVLIPDEAAASPTAAPGPKAGATATKEAPCDYKLKDGDTLAELAKDFGLTVDAIVALNKNITNPDKIVAGACACCFCGLLPGACWGLCACCAERPWLLAGPWLPAHCLGLGSASCSPPPAPHPPRPPLQATPSS